MALFVVKVNWGEGTAFLIILPMGDVKTAMLVSN
jgi:hypothetical protein